MPAGRPSGYDPTYCAKVIELGEQGASIAEMAYEIGVCRNTLKTWAAEQPEFLTAFTRGQLASQVWWERKGRGGMEKPANEFQASIWSRSMAARFPDDWREVRGAELTGRDGGPIKTEGETRLKVDGLNDEQLRALASIPVPTE